MISITLFFPDAPRTQYQYLPTFNMYLYICDEFMVDVSKYSIDGAYVFFENLFDFYHEIAKSGSIQPKTLDIFDDFIM